MDTDQEKTAGKPAGPWRRLSNLRVYGTFQSRVSVWELATGKSPEPADKNVCATSLDAGLASTALGFWVNLIHPDVLYHVLLGQVGVVNLAAPSSAQREIDQ